MRKCQDLDSLLAGYVDGDSAPADRSSVEAHLVKCPPCRERVAEQRTVRAALAASRPALRGCAPPDLRSKCAAYAAAHERPTAPDVAPRRRFRVSRWVPLSVAATVVLAVAGVFLFSPNNRVEALTTQLTLDHMTCFQLAPERLQHADAMTAEQAWLAQHRWGIHVPDSSAANQLELLGVRRCGIGKAGVAHILYKWRGQPLSVFVVPRTMHGPVPDEPVVRFGHEAVVWSDRDRTYVVLTRGQPSDLAAVVGYMKANAR
jgi:anti-sigma factor RsiW